MAGTLLILLCDRCNTSRLEMLNGALGSNPVREQVVVEADEGQGWGSP